MHTFTLLTQKASKSDNARVKPGSGDAQYVRRAAFLGFWPLPELQGAFQHQQSGWCSAIDSPHLDGRTMSSR